MNKRLLSLGLIIWGSAALADNPPKTVTQSQGEARQFGILLGGTASQYDLCTKKGFLPKGNQTAEEIAKSLLEKMRASDKTPDQSAYIQEGWDMMKKEITEHESFYTQEKCSGVGKEWTKIMATMRPK
jgi:hypothetical protein